jgi:hypothetical protein
MTKFHHTRFSLTDGKKMRSLTRTGWHGGNGTAPGTGRSDPVAVSQLQKGMSGSGSTRAAHSNVDSSEITYKTWVHMPPKMAGPFPSLQSLKLAPADPLTKVWLCNPAPG